MKNSVIKLALKGMDKEVLIENLLAMNPEYWFIERLIGGVHVPTLEEFAASKHTPTRNVEIEHKSDLNKENIYISYDYVESAYSTIPIGNTIEEEEFKELDTSWRKNDEHPYIVRYWTHTHDYFASEKFEI
jgi:hypothetical protein